MKKLFLLLSIFTSLQLIACNITNRHSSMPDNDDKNAQKVLLQKTSFSKNSVGNIQASTISQDVTVVPDADREGYVEIFARDRNHAGKDALLEKLYQYYNISITENNNQLNIRVESKKKSIPAVDNISFSFVIHTSKNVNSDINTVSGDVDVKELTGNQKINTVSGDIDYSHTKGNINLSTVSGDASVNNVNGIGSFSSVSGDMDIAQLAGNTSIQTTSGDISISNINGDAKVNTVSGDVRVATVSGDISTTTTSGDIRIKLPSNAGYAVKFSTVSGDMNLNNFTLNKMQKSKRNISGEIGDGSRKLSSTTVSGDITIE